MRIKDPLISLALNADISTTKNCDQKECNLWKDINEIFRTVVFIYTKFFSLRLKDPLISLALNADIDKTKRV